MNCTVIYTLHTRKIEKFMYIYGSPQKAKLLYKNVLNNCVELKTILSKASGDFQATHTNLHCRIHSAMYTFTFSMSRF